MAKPPSNNSKPADNTLDMIKQLLNNHNNNKIQENTPYGTLNSARTGIIKYFKENKNTVVEEKIKKLNMLLNSKKKNDEFILTALAGIIYIYTYIYIFIYIFPI